MKVKKILMAAIWTGENATFSGASNILFHNILDLYLGACRLTRVKQAE